LIHNEEFDITQLVLETYYVGPIPYWGYMLLDNIRIEATPKFDLGNDTTLAICGGDSLVLSPGPGYSTFLWQNGSEEPTFVVDSTGLYWVQASTAEGCSWTDSIFITVEDYVEMVSQMIDSTVVCEGQEITLFAAVGNGIGPYSYEWLNLPDTTESVVVTAEVTMYYYVEVTDHCGFTLLDSVKLIVRPIPEIEIGEDQIICQSDTLVLSAGSNQAAYQWQDGTTDSVCLVTTPGWYWVNVTSYFGCVGNDSVYIEFYPPVSTNLGSDTLLCESSTLLLDAGPGFSSYLWYDNTSGQTVTIDETGLYWVTVTDQNGCTGTDTIQVGLSSAVTVSLGGDTTLCANDEYILSPGTGFTQYLWQNGSEASFLEVTLPGTYWVQVLDENGCDGADTIQVGLNPSPVVDLGPDTNLCEGESLALDVGNSYASYLWQDNSTASTYYVYESGYYSITVTNYFNCPASDEIIVEISSPDIDLGPDSSICYHDSIYLQPGDDFAYYEWQDGSFASTYHVTSSGIYSVSVMDEFGCTDEDDVELILVYAPTADLGEDQLLCSGNTITLEAPVGPYTYYWNGVEGTATYKVSEGGEYTVQLLNICGDASDSIFVEEIETPEVDLGQDVLLNPGESIELDAGPGFDTYLWQDGSTNQILLVTSESVNVPDPVYYVEVTKGPCKGSDTVEVVVFIVELPLVFTPNNDGKNDIFLYMKDSWKGITSHHMSIFNRWGEQVWESEHFEEGWDGRQNGKLVADGTYFWVLELYYGPENIKQVQQGTVTVLGATN
jgi:gliding motility-associated-like protein